MSSAITEDSPIDSLSWSVRLSDGAPGKLVGIWAAALAAGVAGWMLFDNLWFALIGFAIILAATAEFWLGVRYRLDANGASSRCGLSVNSVAWQDVRRATVNGNTIRLTPLAEAGRLDPFRGVVLRVGGEMHAQVVEEIRRRTGIDV